jgi:hypothetical protein
VILRRVATGGVVAAWGALLWWGIAWNGREVELPSLVPPDVVTMAPDPMLPVPFPRSTLPPHRQPAQ